MAQRTSSLTHLPLVYPLVSGPGIARWLVACLLGFIGWAFVVFSIMAIPSALQGNFDGPSFLLGVFFLIGLGVLAVAMATVLYRHCIVIDLRTRTVTRHRTWGPITRTRALACDEVRAVRLMHDTRRREGKKGGSYSGGSYTVCAMKLVSRKGEVWHLCERPTVGEAMRRMLPSVVGRIATDYEQLQRDEATKLCAATGWRLEDRLERSTTGWVPAASEPCAHRVEDIGPSIRGIDAPAWLQRAVPRRVRRRWQTVLVSLLGWGVIVGPLLAAAIWVGARYRDVQSMRTIDAKVIGLAHDWNPGGYGVDYRFAVDGREYTRWEMNVSPAIWAEAQSRESIQVSYLPRDPRQSNLGLPPPVLVLPQNWMVMGLERIPSFLVAIAVAVGMWRRANRIARAKFLGERGCMRQGMVFRRAQKVGVRRTQSRLTINGVTLFNPWTSPEYESNQIRYEFIVDGKKQFGYVPATSLGIFRRDGLVGVMYDPHFPEVHLPLPAVERYLAFD